MYKTEADGHDMERPDMLIPAPSDTYISDGAPGSPLVVGGGGCEGLLPTLGARVHHPLLPQAGLQSFTFGRQSSLAHHLRQKKPDSQRQRQEMAPARTAL